MKYLKKTGSFLLILLLLPGITGCSSDEDGDVIISNSLVDFIEANPEYSSFNTALELTNFKTTLTSGSYTIFALNNAAFNTLLSENEVESLDAVPVNILTLFLQYHILEGVIFSEDFSSGYYKTLATWEASEENLSMYVNTENGILINGTSAVNIEDISVDNGVLHIVEEAIIPPDLTILLSADPALDSFNNELARDEVDFITTLENQESPAPFTVFAPTNDAFVDLLEELELDSASEIPSETLSNVLGYHLVTNGNILLDEETEPIEVTALNGGSFSIQSNGEITIIDESGRTSNVTVMNIQAINGVIHVIDRVLLPAVE